MSRRVRNFQYRKFLSEKLDNAIMYKQRKEHLINLKFKKSPVFIISWTTRILFILFFILVVFTHTIPRKTSVEVILIKNIDRYISTNRYGTNGKTVANLYLKTDKNEYNTNIAGLSIPSTEINDTIVIERNFYGKPIYFYKKNWTKKFPFSITFMYYFLVLFMTLLSMFFNNVLDKSTVGLYIFTIIIEILAIIFYCLY